MGFSVDPFKRFEEWFSEARKAGEPQPEAMALATASREGRPDVRMVLHKGIYDGKFGFFTNYSSSKSQDLESNPQAALTFFWFKIFKQIRVRGKVEKASSAISDSYWKTRPRESQLGAWASPQSHSIVSPEELEKKVVEIAKKFEGIPVPRPEFWGGYLLVPEEMEFWTGKEFRLHEREIFTRENGNWLSSYLAP